MKNTFAFTSLPFVFISLVVSRSVPFGILSQQCLHETLLLSANLACSQNGTADLISHIGQPILTTSYPKNSGRANFAPWSYEPVCTRILEDIESELCVYTSITFDNGRGISIFTTPRIAEEFGSLLPFHDPTVLDGINNPAGPWYAQKLPGKGMGMLARRNLKRGDLITAYTPALLVHKEKALSIQEREEFLRLAVDQLPVATKESYFKLTTVFGDPTVIVQDVVQANSFEMQVGGQMHLAIFPEPSRLNHDCAPNSQYYLDPSLLTHYVHATRPISQDEEITISYSSPFDPFTTRQERLLNSFHFTCRCSRCLAGDSSDAVLAEIMSLQQNLADWDPGSTATPEKAEKLIRLYEQEGLEAFLETAYGHAALAYNAVGDSRRAKKYGGLAADAAVLKGGPGATHLKTWKQIIDNPKGHWSWKWRTRG